MIEAWGTQEVYAAETALMATLPEGGLMARAVEGLIAVTRARIEERGARRVVGLIGTGNNGADALYALAHLAADGHPVAAVTTERVHTGAREAAVEAGVVLASGVEAAAMVADADLVLDGVLGIGGRPEVPDFARAWVAAVADEAYVMAVDLPTGADPAGRSGDPDGVFADETVTFSVLKPVHLMPATEARCGRLTVVDIGLEIDTPPAVRRLVRDDVSDLWPVPGPTDDKYSRGVVGVVAGSQDFPGAAVLAVTAAVAAGAGMVRYVGPSRPADLVASAVPEAVHGQGRVQAWVVGPGLVATDENGADRLDPQQRRVIEEALASQEPVLVDAGGLDLLLGTDLGMRRGRPTLLTPHAGECARLLGVERAEVEADPVAHAGELARRSGATVLLKGSHTIVLSSDGDGAVWSQADAPAWTGTAGAGDVLSGLVGTLLAAGLEPGVAGALGALVHGIASDDSNPGGPVRALGIAEALPEAVAGLLRR
ncbi:bifunctional ADP-dependent NAD(P)H-hydrate dehydratase/NAD(P)H-hydrate epimerase [Nostocoides sp. F2B08]|uniref:bifunctional ADP-dependent NAD(P)H-hydrate dehydratase/NAD(P)H-hydrate epimerase n=1 Tax=Nostocoides sp. F2B08 TaxID=2653936 RepID=UPI001262EFD1|nr:bifunctional ADP-dependent NAD(P)H-hydrate dehydratase/NAD(P)H-hydrate epimerase [Tetrasphaera sp. F2B08]KAB7743559.1 bifunctional ADP-dependent NAD(P)H-hydrate dehydratase/NAD(P)H-hydrate epimerase [Tetrasphaera sp. F2B08]